MMTKDYQMITKIINKKRINALLLVAAIVSVMMLILTSCRSTREPVVTETANNSYNKTLVVATDDNYWPYVYYDMDGQLTGHDIELITVVANELNIDDRDKAMDSMIKVQESSTVLVSLVNNILDMSRIESGKATIHENSVNINDVFTNIRPMLEQHAKGKNIQIEFDISHIRDNHVMCDVVHTQQILMNLITNAIKYTPDGGNVWMKVRHLDGYTNGRGNYEFTVKDNGYGMSPAYREIAFDMFSREESSTVSGIQGTGLGLPLCKKISEMMGGSIIMESEQGVGSTFTVVLPLTILKDEKNEIIADQFTANNASFKGKRLFLVEDNELNREIAIDILEDEGIVVETAEDGRAAVEKIKQNGSDYYNCMEDKYSCTCARRALSVAPSSSMPCSLAKVLRTASGSFFICSRSSETVICSYSIFSSS